MIERLNISAITERGVVTRAREMADSEQVGMRKSLSRNLHTFRHWNPLVVAIKHKDRQSNLRNQWSGIEVHIRPVGSGATVDTATLLMGGRTRPAPGCGERCLDTGAERNRHRQSASQWLLFKVMSV